MKTQEEVEREFYGRALATAKTGAASTGYGMPINQTMRFATWNQLAMPDPHESILDVGSGTGDLLAYMDEKDIKFSMYHGVDIMPEMTQAAQERWNGRDNCMFTTYDVHDKVFPLDSVDHVVSIAAYALKAPHDSQQENIKYVQESIEEMALIARKTVFVTLFSTWKTNIIPEEMVLDPVTMFAWAKSRWERVDLIHSYAPFDFSLAIYLEPSEWRQAWEANSQS